MDRTLEVFLYAPRGPPVKAKKPCKSERGCVAEWFKASDL